MKPTKIKIERGEKTYAYIIPKFTVFSALLLTFAAGLSTGFVLGVWVAFG